MRIYIKDSSVNKKEREERGTMSIKIVSNIDEYKSLSLSLSLLFFWANWHESSRPGGQMHGVIEALALKYNNTTISFISIDAEQVPDLVEIYGIDVVPSFIALHSGQIIGKVDGANPPDVMKLVKQLADLPPPPVTTSIKSNNNNNDNNNIIDNILKVKLTNLINTAPVMLFMKGAPSAPRCGFSRQIVEILQSQSIPFASFDILTDEDVRGGLKTLSDWPTYPQLYVNGELVGGLDIVKEMIQEGDLKEQLGISNLQLPVAVQTLDERLSKLINEDKVMLFMKGSPETPKCGFSRTIVSILQDASIPFASFDILTDEEVRAGLKVFSDWPTYPQLYVNGELVGGLDIVKEMIQEGDLKEQLGLQ